eukprot:459291_1
MDVLQGMFIVFIHWVEDEYTAMSAFLHCIAATLIVLGTLTLFCLYLPHMVSHEQTTQNSRHYDPYWWRPSFYCIYLSHRQSNLLQLLFMRSAYFCVYDTRNSDDIQIDTLMALIFEIIWCILMINCGVLMF